MFWKKKSFGYIIKKTNRLFRDNLREKLEKQSSRARGESGANRPSDPHTRFNYTKTYL